MRRVTRCAASVVLAASAITAVLAAGPASADSPPSYFSQLAVADNREFVASPASTAIAVFDEDGRPFGSITGEPGVTGLVASPDGTRLYAALPLAHAIAVLDPVTLRQLHRYSTGSGSCPTSLTATPTEIWSVDPCLERLAAVDPASGTLGPAYEADGGSLIVSSPTVADRLFLLEQGSPGVIDEYATQGNAVVGQIASATTPEGVVDAAISADGSELVTAIPGENTYQRYSTANLTALTGYPTLPAAGRGYEVAVAVDGSRLAAGAELGTPQVRLFEGDAAPATGFDFPQPRNSPQPVLVARGLAFSADGTRLYAVTDADVHYLPAVLHTYSAIDPPSPQPTELVVSAPAAVPQGSAIRITGQLLDAGTVPVPAADITVDGAPYITDDNGRFSLNEVSHSTGAAGDQQTITVSYAGDAWHQAAAPQSVVTAVEHLRTTLSVGRSAAYVGYDQPVTVTVHLGPTADGRTVAVHLDPYGEPGTLLRQADVDATGSLSVTARITGRTSFGVTFAGDSDYLPATAGTQVAAGSSLTETVSGCGSVSHGVRVCKHTAVPTITAHLKVRTPAGKCVHVTRQAYSSGHWSAGATTGCLRVNSSGAATTRLSAASQRRIGRYRFQATWAGDVINGKSASGWQYLTLT